MGCNLSEHEYGRSWTRQERMSHINILKLKAAFLALQTFAARFSNCHILLLIDNTTAIAYINHKLMRHSFSGIVEPNNRNVGMVLVKEPVDSHPRLENVSADMEFRRSLDPSNWFLLQVTRSQMGTIRHGPFHGPSQQAVETLLQFSSRPASREDRCIGSSMVKSKTTYLPAVHPPRENTPQDRTGGSEGTGTHCTSMGKSVMVFPTARESGQSPNHSPRNTSTLPQPYGRAPLTGNLKTSKTGHLESVWGQVKDRGLSEEAFKILFSSWRHGTEKFYSSVWSEWVHWCSERSSNPFPTVVAPVIEFLAAQFKEGSSILL